MLCAQFLSEVTSTLKAMSSDVETWRPAKPTAAALQVPRTSGKRAAAEVMAAAPAAGQSASRLPSVQRKRRLNGMAIAPDMTLSWGKRLIRNPYFWTTIALTLLYALLIGLSLWQVTSSLIEEVNQVTTEQGQPVVYTWSQMREALGVATKAAVPTLLVFLAIFLVVDIFNPTSIWMKWVALGWGGAVAIYLSLEINTWAARLMQMVGPVDPSTGARSAIFSAPFVEEVTKASVLFLLAVLLRRRMLNVHQVVTLAALAAVGFAFVENIVYYVRVYVYSVSIHGVDPEEQLAKLARLRGLATCFGHPLFTSMTALGLIVGLTNRSKLIRVLAPVAGFLAAAFGHMLFNGMATTVEDPQPIIIGGWIAVAVLVIYLVFRRVHQGRQVRARLQEFVTMGWLEEDDPRVYTNTFGRVKMEFVALLHGARVFGATRRVRKGILELAYLRDAELRGLVDATSIARQRDLILRIDQDRIWAVTEYRGLKWIPESLKAKVRAWRNRRRADGEPSRPSRRPQGKPQSTPQHAGQPIGAPAGVR